MVCIENFNRVRLSAGRCAIAELSNCRCRGSVFIHLEKRLLGEHVEPDRVVKIFRKFLFYLGGVILDEFFVQETEQVVMRELCVELRNPKMELLADQGRPHLVPGLGIKRLDDLLDRLVLGRKNDCQVVSALSHRDADRPEIFILEVREFIRLHHHRNYSDYFLAIGERTHYCA